MIKEANALIILIIFCIFVIFLLFKEEIRIMQRRQIFVYSIPKNLITFDDPKIPADSWHCINQSACIYSAYWDERFPSPFVRLIAVVSKNAKISSWRCVFNDNGTGKAIPLKMKKIPEDHGKDYIAVFLLCYIKKRPKEVKIIADQLKTTSTVVHTTKLENNARRKIAVCVRPIFGEFPNNNSMIAEFISYYQELGADHFTFYDYKIGPSLKKLFYELTENEFPIVVLPWNLPKPFSSAWAYGQMAFAADCLYRNSHNYEFVATLDVDEFIIPKEDISLTNVIERVSRKNSRWGTYIFRQTFFCMEYENDPHSINSTISLITQTKTRHERKIWPYFDRSKCIVRPAAVIVPGIHFSWIHLQSWKTKLIDTNVALLHHYRANKCEISTNDIGVIETRALRYGKRILESSVLQVWRKLNL